MRDLFISAILVGTLFACNQSQTNTDNIGVRLSVFDKPKPENVSSLKHITQELVAPPLLPEHQQEVTGNPVVVEVKLTAIEKKIEVAPGVYTWALTYNGTVPAPIIVVHQNDYVQLTLVNPSSNIHEHNIDFHAAIGAHGGGALTHVSPGQEATFRFRVTKPGVFVYHCAPGGIMTAIHVVSGMNGVIMVLPREGLKDENGNSVHYDKAYYVVEQDFYLAKDKNGKYKEYTSSSEGFDDLIKTMRTLVPSHIVFNGREGALTGENALTANVGEKVLFITSQANRDTRIHMIGGSSDLVWLGGSFTNKPATCFQSWPVAAGSSVAMMYQFRQPGTYLYLNHNLIEAFSFGAMAEVKVDGELDKDLMEAIHNPNPGH